MLRYLRAQTGGNKDDKQSLKEQHFYVFYFNTASVVSNRKSKPQKAATKAKDNITQVHVSTLSSRARTLPDVYFYMYNRCSNTLHSLFFFA